MNSKHSLVVRQCLLIVGAITALAVGPTAVQAIEICHEHERGGSRGLNWKQISVGSASALAAHLKNHADGIPRQAVPGFADLVFDDRCNPVLAELQPTTPYVCSSDSTDYTMLYVRDISEISEEGTVERPCHTVSAALTYAAVTGLAAVELQIAPGIYAPENIGLDRSVRLVGSGSPGTTLTTAITNEGPYALGIQGLGFAANPGFPALDIRNPDAATALCNVHLNGATDHALAQVGGTLNVDNLLVTGVVGDPGVPWPAPINGSGLKLGGGVNANLTNLTVDGFEGTGVYARDTDTEVYIDWFGSSNSVVRNGLGCSGVQVTAGASLRADHLSIVDSTGMGLWVIGTGTVVDVPHLTVQGATTENPAQCTRSGPSSVVVEDNPTLSLTGTEADPFVLTNSELEALRFRGAGIPALTITGCIISDSLVGVAIFLDDPDSVKFVYEQVRQAVVCQRSVLMSDVPLQFHANEFPAPEPCQDPGGL